MEEVESHWLLAPLCTYVFSCCLNALKIHFMMLENYFDSNDILCHWNSIIIWLTQRNKTICPACPNEDRNAFGTVGSAMMRALVVLMYWRRQNGWNPSVNEGEKRTRVRSFRVPVVRSFALSYSSVFLAVLLLLILFENQNFVTDKQPFWHLEPHFVLDNLEISLQLAQTEADAANPPRI